MYVDMCVYIPICICVHAYVYTYVCIHMCGYALGEVPRLVRDAPREAKVRDLEVAVGVDQDVGGLEVPVGMIVIVWCGWG